MEELPKPFPIQWDINDEFSCPSEGTGEDVP
jgi:hypothetical protein